MQLVVERAPALSALARAVGIVERKQTIPILGNVALKAEAEHLTVRATDLDMEAIETIPARVVREGDTTIPADKLDAIVRSADPGAQLAIFTEDGDPRVKVKSGRSRFNLPALPAADFPKFVVDDLGAEFVIPATLLADMLARVTWAVSKANTNSVLTCAYLGAHGDMLHAVGGSNSGVALRREPLPEGAAISAILPMKFVGQAIKWLSNAEGDAYVSSSKNLIRVRHASGQLTSKLFDAPAYVDYLRILIEEHELSARMAQDELSAALKRALIMREAKAPTVRLSFTSGSLTIQARDGQAGEGVDEIGAEYEGPEVTFLLNAGHLQDTLSALKGDIIELAFASAAQPGVVKSIQTIIRAPSDAGYLVNLAQPRA